MEEYKSFFYEGIKIFDAKIRIADCVAAALASSLQKAVEEKDDITEAVILGEYPMHLSSELLNELTDDQWDIVSGCKRINEVDVEDQCPLSDYFISKYADKLNWDTLCKCYQNQLSDNILSEFSDRLDWNLISQSQLSPTFVDQYANMLDWNLVSKQEGLTEEFIATYQDRVNWSLISEFQELSEDFIEEYMHKIDFQKLLESEYAPRISFVANMLTRAYQY